ncbi:MAG: carboxymuconolactone decarboxylase family protein [Dehalococcoidia bacterium]
MARIPVITRKEDVPPGGQQAFDSIAASRGGRISGPFSVLLHSPELASRIAHTGAYVRFESSLPNDTLELATIAGAREIDCQYEWSAHEGQARDAGVREEAIVAIRDRKAPEGLTQDEAVIVKYVQELLRSHRVSEPTFNAAMTMLGVQKLMDLTATVGYYGMIGCALNAFDVQPETPLLPV